MKVRCVDDSGVTGVTNGKVYTVQSYTPTMYNIVGDAGIAGNFIKGRFTIISDVVVKVGQIWRNTASPNDHFEMTRIQRSVSGIGWRVLGYYMSVLSGTRIGGEISFGSLNEDYTPDGWSAWELHKEVEAPKQTATKDVSDWRAWAHNKPGDCPCGIAREVCAYHRT